MQDFEKLGAFYLGREYDIAQREGKEDLLLYNSKDLCTHAVVVGMTGSGKTGLCVNLLEEAAIDRIPSIIIDPKGDISNLLLSFPNLTPEEFRPWVDEGQAEREGISPEVFATNEAEKWKKGLESWGQDAERIRMMRDTVDMRVYTPGATFGRPLTILKSFDAPNEQVLNDSDLLADRISSTSSGLLSLLGIDADPIRSKEHILISNILNHSWSKGQNLDLGTMISKIQDPPFERVGIMELDKFYPEKERRELAMTLNNLLASPSFSNWMMGEPVNIKRMLHTDQMDEVFGYFPPVKNPPSKQPMLTLLKQARAFGLGCVLATQNPVDLDYKGLSNAGTWFLGRLQTERDKARVLEGLEGASTQAGSKFDKGAMEETLAGLGAEATSADRPGTRKKRASLAPQVDQQQLVPSSVEQYFVECNRRLDEGQRLIYRPTLIGEGRLHYVRATYKVDKWMDLKFLAEVESGDRPDEIWPDADPLVEVLDFCRKPDPDAEFDELPSEMQKSKSYTSWKKELKEYLYRERAMTIHKCTDLKKYSEPGEELGDFKVRLEQLASEKRDEAREKLEKKYASKLSTLRDRIRRAEDKVEVQEDQYKQSQRSSMISIGTTVLGALFGRSLVSATSARRAGSSMRAAGRVSKEKADIGRAEEDLEAAVRKYEDLEAEFTEDMEDLEEKLTVDEMDFEELRVPPRKSDISIEQFGVCWMPFVVDESGDEEPAY